MPRQVKLEIKTYILITALVTPRISEPAIIDTVNQKTNPRRLTIKLEIYSHKPLRIISAFLNINQPYTST